MRNFYHFLEKKGVGGGGAKHASFWKVMICSFAPLNQKTLFNMSFPPGIKNNKTIFQSFSDVSKEEHVK